MNYVLYLATISVPDLYHLSFFPQAVDSGLYCRFRIPKEYGGMGYDDFRYNLIVEEELEYADCSSVFFPLGSDIVLPYFTHITTEEQKKRWLPRVRYIPHSTTCSLPPLRPLVSSHFIDYGGYILLISTTFTSMLFPPPSLSRPVPLTQHRGPYLPDRERPPHYCSGHV